MLYYFVGSWDYTIRVWDTRDGTCLDTVYDHGADVYGKTQHAAQLLILQIHYGYMSSTICDEQKTVSYMK